MAEGRVKTIHLRRADLRESGALIGVPAWMQHVWMFTFMMLTSAAENALRGCLVTGSKPMTFDEWRGEVLPDMRRDLARKAWDLFLSRGLFEKRTVGGVEYIHLWDFDHHQESGRKDLGRAESSRIKTGLTQGQHRTNTRPTRDQASPTVENTGVTPRISETSSNSLQEENVRTERNINPVEVRVDVKHGEPSPPSGGVPSAQPVAVSAGRANGVGDRGGRRNGTVSSGAGPDNVERGPWPERGRSAGATDTRTDSEPVALAGAVEAVVSGCAEGTPPEGGEGKAVSTQRRRTSAKCRARAVDELCRVTGDHNGRRAWVRIVEAFAVSDEAWEALGERISGLERDLAADAVNHRAPPSRPGAVLMARLRDEDCPRLGIRWPFKPKQEAAK